MYNLGKLKKKWTMDDWDRGGTMIMNQILNEPCTFGEFLDILSKVSNVCLQIFYLFLRGNVIPYSSMKKPILNTEAVYQLYNSYFIVLGGLRALEQGGLTVKPEFGDLDIPDPFCRPE